MRHLEDKYDEIIRIEDEKVEAARRKRFAEQTDFLKMNKHGQEKYNHYTDKKRQYQQDRKRVLNTFVAINQAEIEEFN